LTTPTTIALVTVRVLQHYIASYKVLYSFLLFKAVSLSTNILENIVIM